MSSSSSTAHAQLIAEYEGVITTTICIIAVTTLLLYDIILTTGQECQSIWCSSKTWVSRALYVLNRYVVFLSNILNLGTIPPISDTSCTVVMWLTQFVLIMSLIGPAVFTTLRIYALSRKNKILSGVALVLSMVPFLVNVVNPLNPSVQHVAQALLMDWLLQATAYGETLPINLPAPENCTSYSTLSTKLYTALVCVSRGCLILVDTLAVAVTWRQTRRVSIHTGCMQKRSLEEVMWEKGSFYFCTLVSLNVADLVLVIASTAIVQDGGGPHCSYVLLFIDVISSILNSRFLLALHETSARLEGENTSISSLCFNIDADGDPIRDGSPELPGFLELLGGSIRSLHDDEDVDWIEFARPSESQGRVSEPEGDGGAGDADIIAVQVRLDPGCGGEEGSLV